MALAGVQTVHLVDTVDGKYPSLTGSPFPPVTPVTSTNRFPSSPTPAFALLTSMVNGGPVAFSDPVNYPQANTSISVSYYIGSVIQTSTILVTETVSVVQGAL